ncbi:hypothetical protein [Pseudodesulfovibrio tunisiensis]|uniref:hypothetical protein n=1 Tax=Pseudodesulfovibrio tunisiensis TaxID=463192 RepID=UPI001FB49F14|nr:hypothetical protein [Pseudodesulfovibrio tunisiensis]
MKQSWETTKDYIDPPPEIDTDSYQFTNPNQEKLAKLMTPVDGPLSSLIRFVEDKDSKPDENWQKLLVTRFPWVHRVFVTDGNGEILFQQPGIPIKKFSEPLEFWGVWREISMATVVDYADLGAELYIGRPYFENIDFKGLIGVGFDPRSLLNLAPHPEELLFIHPGGGVWSLGEVDERGILDLPWDEILREHVQGQVKVGDKYYTWLVKYIGEEYYIYATESVDPKADGDSGWWLF